LKKAVLIVSALLLVVSGVAAVSAYEGHLVDIKAHVENAIGVDTYELDFGTSFPQEQREEDLLFGLSNSFMDVNQTRVSSVTYELYWELKPVGEHDPEPLYLDAYFQPLNPFLYVYFLNPDGDTIDSTAAKTVPAAGAAVKFGEGTLAKTVPSVPAMDDCMDGLHFTFYVPVFEGYYNEITDPKPDYSYMLKEGEFVTVNETICNSFEAEVPHADLGINLKIQVTGFGYE
jgi:hypothetical protein